MVCILGVHSVESKNGNCSHEGLFCKLIMVIGGEAIECVKRGGGGERERERERER